MQPFLDQIRAHKLDRIAAAYAVVAWIVVQGAAIALPSFNAAPWVLRTLIIVAVVGLPVVLAIGWVRGATHPDTTPHARRLFGALLIGGVVVAVALGVVAYVYSDDQATPPTAPIAGPAPNSIAVLPFVNMSGDASQDYFSDGISEELLNDLANTPELRVAARTSSFVFKGRRADIKEIAHALNVRTVLEGSIRRAGNRVRITAQLINAADGYHLWSATYDRDLTDILNVQTEIAQAITQALIHKLLPARAGRPKTIAPDIYSAYLQGKFFFDRRNKDGNERAIALFRRVAAAEPEFADGWAALGYALIIEYITFEEPRGTEATNAAAKDSVERALTLDPKNLVALLTKLNIALAAWDWDGAGEALKKMRAINPQHALVLRATSNYSLMLGLPERSIAANVENTKLDPLSFIERLDLAEDLIGEKRYVEAEEAARAALVIEPADNQALHALCISLAATGRAAEARAVEARLTTAPPDFFDMTEDCRFEIARHTGDLALARRIAERNASQHSDIYVEIGTEFAELGDFDRAMDAIETMFALRQPEFFSIVYDKNIPPALYQSARWRALAAQPEFQRWQAAHDKAAAELSTPRN